MTIKNAREQRGNGQGEWVGAVPEAKGATLIPTLAHFVISFCFSRVFCFNSSNSFPLSALFSHLLPPSPYLALKYLYLFLDILD